MIRATPFKSVMFVLSTICCVLVAAAPKPVNPTELATVRRHGGIGGVRLSAVVQSDGSFNVTNEGNRNDKSARNGTLTPSELKELQHAIDRIGEFRDRYPPRDGAFDFFDDELAAGGRSVIWSESTAVPEPLRRLQSVLDRVFK